LVPSPLTRIFAISLRSCDTLSPCFGPLLPEYLCPPTTTGGVLSHCAVHYQRPVVSLATRITSHMARPKRDPWSDEERGLLVDLRSQNPQPSWASIVCSHLYFCYIICLCSHLFQTRYFPSRTKEALQTEMNRINKKKKREELKEVKGSDTNPDGFSFY
jgi:hypothetical protein